VKGKLKISLIEDPVYIWELKEEWDELLRKSIDYSPFLTPQWVGVSRDYFAFDKGLRLVVVREEDGRLVGILPFAESEDTGIEWMQDPETTPFSDFIMLPERRKEILDIAFDLIRRNKKGADLKYLRGDSPTLREMELRAQKENLRTKKWVVNRVPRVLIQQDFERFVFSLSREDRKKVTAILSKIERKYNLRVNIHKSPKEVAKALDVFFSLFSQVSEKNREYMEPGREAFLREVFPLLAKEGIGKLIVIKADGFPVCAALTMETSSTLYVYATSWDPNSKELFPTTLLFVKLIEEASRRKLKSIEALPLCTFSENVGIFRGQSKIFGFVIST